MYVFGNGESRTSVKINDFDGPKVGCNAIMRDHNVDYLVCVDKRMVEEAINREVSMTGDFVCNYLIFQTEKSQTYDNILLEVEPR